MKRDASGKELADIIEKARPGHPLRNWAIIAVLTALAVAGWWYYGKETEPTGPDFKTESVSRGDLSITVTATGNLQPTIQVTVGSELSGTAAEVYVDINAQVKKGQPIAKLDTAKLDQQTDRSRAALLAAKARVNQVAATKLESNASLARFEELHRLSGGKTPSKADMDNAIATVERSKADLESAEASVAQAQADLKSIERDLSKTIIRSPVDGIILTRSLEVGQTVAASFTAPELFKIAEDLKKMELLVAVAEADIGSVEAGQPASFTVDAWPSRTYQAIVKKVSFGSLVTNNVVTYSTELEVSNDDLSLRPGMTATADISVARAEKVLLIPNAALRFDPAVTESFDGPEKKDKTLVQSLSPGGGRFRRGPGAPPPKVTPRSTEGARVWTLKDGQPFEVPVKTGITDGRFTEVTGDTLTEGMEVITSATPPATK